MFIYRVFIKYCVFSEDFKIFLTLFPLGVSVCTRTRQVENLRCSRTDNIQKNQKILRKNTIFNEHPVYEIIHVHEAPQCLAFKSALRVGEKSVQRIRSNSSMCLLTRKWREEEQYPLMNRGRL